ncbi:hypothetical protein WYO_0040 [Methylobacterium sp. GXF4]|uniref:DUF2946 domain-containing protein n=1 Tax=Methylobacterium brachiatum TaxID=269660 RepID=A0AAJ1WWZ7_9HYPH|nr:hypothetical protein [Methylobacterium sp. E-005]EIZ87176.1 hypothetical protein WYO_0040 [Methylobacterium sp. GXF4]MCJ2086169.1 hypothetical protein [Methylobacterium sp. E-005]MDQ0544285.1 hypothetical protein [Methylobacterium brachiatum]
MDFGGWHRRRQAARDGWALAVRTLMLVLTFAFAAPSAGFAEDLAFHAGGHHRATELTVFEASAAPSSADPGLACHAHCGCHQLAYLDGAPLAPAPDRPRPSYARTAEAPVAIAPGRPARPPRT